MIGDAMGNIDGLTTEEIKELILDDLRDVDADVEGVEVEVSRGPVVVLKGKVDSEADREIIIETITDIVGVDDIRDEMIVIEDVEDLDAAESEEEGVSDQEDKDVGTEDAFQSVEDGIPYIPPMRPTHRGPSETSRWKKRKRR